MIHKGLLFGLLFDVELAPGCLDAVEALCPLLQLIFIFVQLYFVFLNAKVSQRRANTKKNST